MVETLLALSAYWSIISCMDTVVETCSQAETVEQKTMIQEIMQEFLHILHSP